VHTYTTQTTQKPKVMRTITKKVVQNLGNGCQLVEIDGVIYYDYNGKTLNLARKEEEVKITTAALLIESSSFGGLRNIVEAPLELNVLTYYDWSYTYISYDMSRQIFLKKLVLHSNDIEIFPPNWLNLTNMEDFECSSNKLTELPDGLKKWIRLTHLNLKENKFPFFPPVIFQLNKLKTLDLSQNFIKVIPSSIVILSNLESLHLSFNLLQTIPLELTQLKSLKILKLDYNQLTDLPLEITALTNLKVLDLSGNQINVQKFRWLMPTVKILG
jgi:Leucine rich repeat/Leucine Rich Repeat